jgi:hypothetical protein
MENKFQRDEIMDTGFDGDGCYNCMHNPRYENRRKRGGKPTVSREVFEEELTKLNQAYGTELDLGTHDSYWDHLAYAFRDDAEFQDIMYRCIDVFEEFPAIAQILEVMNNLRQFP